MKWYKILYQFWMTNLERNAKRISVGFGSFLIVIITTCSLPTHIFLASLYGAGIAFGSMVIMSIFGKNGNGNGYPTRIYIESERTEPTELIGKSNDSVKKPEPEPIKEKITLP